MKTEALVAETAWSPRSQRNLLRERALREKLTNCDKWTGYHEREVAEAEESKARQLRHSVETKDSYPEWLSQTLRDLEDNRRRLAAFKEQRAQIEAEIEGLAPSPAQIAERAERQSYAGQLSGERVEKDKHIDATLKVFRRLLGERQELTAKLLKAAEAADLTVGDDGLDARRFDELFATLPEDLLAASVRWHDWFVGKGDELKRYVVVVGELTLPESIASAGVHRFGDKVELADDKAAELLREICPLGRARHDLGWSFEPPRIMPLAEFEALVGDSPEHAEHRVSQRNSEFEAKLKAQYEVEYGEALRAYRRELRAQGRLMGGNPADD